MYIYLFGQLRYHTLSSSLQGFNCFWRQILTLRFTHGAYANVHRRKQQQEKDNMEKMSHTTESSNETFNGLIDDGSTISFVDSDLRNRIMSSTIRRPIDLGVSGLNRATQEIRSEEIILPLHNQNGTKFDVEAIVIEKIFWHTTVSLFLRKMFVTLCKNFIICFCSS